MFQLENRYIVIKRTDLNGLEEIIDQETWITFQGVTDYAKASRIKNNKSPLNCIVVESDWPEYNMVLEAIKARVGDDSNGIKCGRCEQEMESEESAEGCDDWNCPLK